MLERQKEEIWRGKSKEHWIYALFDRRLSKTYSVVSLNEGVVDSDDLDVGVLDGVAENDTANATEAVDADLDGSHCE
jgi:hypothetical protein